MGLHVHSLGELPIEPQRGYYVYLLDYGWYEPLGEALYKNFERMADLASRHDAVVMRGTRGSHFEDEVLSWHSINGEPTQELLPAILITTRHPATFLRSGGLVRGVAADHPLLLIPVKHHCRTSSDVAALVHAIFNDIRDKKRLDDFQVAGEQHRGEDGAITDAYVLKRNVSDSGISLDEIARFLGRDDSSERISSDSSLDEERRGS